MRGLKQIALETRVLQDARIRKRRKLSVQSEVPSPAKAISPAEATLSLKIRKLKRRKLVYRGHTPARSENVDLGLQPLDLCLKRIDLRLQAFDFHFQLLLIGRHGCLRLREHGSEQKACGESRRENEACVHGFLLVVDKREQVNESGCGTNGCDTSE